MYGVSVDTPEQNRALIEKLILPYALLSDPDGEVIRRYGVWDEEGQIARPAIFAIDREGVVRYVYFADALEQTIEMHRQRGSLPA